MRRMVLDRFQRPLRSLRISVTDRCNLRCRYCMPEEEYTWLPRGDLLRFEEMAVLVECFVQLGVVRLRLTGGEPLARRNLPELVQLLASIDGVDDLAMTTNGILLPPHAKPLVQAGLKRVTVSIDTLKADRFLALTGRDSLDKVLAGIEAAREAGAVGIKLNTVAMRGFNDDELVDMIEFARSVGAEPRFIEYMDVGGATRWSRGDVLPQAEILKRLGDHYGSVEPLASTTAPAQRYRLPDGQTFGIVASTTSPFCSGCDRSRVTADGRYFLCLYARDGIDLRDPLRQGATAGELRALIEETWAARDDRGAEERVRLASGRLPLVQKSDLGANPHLEMHTRGG